jgi:hypothetical protein
MFMYSRRFDVKATVSIVDDEGNRYEGDVELSRVAVREQVRKSSPNTAPKAGTEIDYSLPIRAFTRRYAATATSGAAKFTILLAYLTHSSSAEDIPNEDIDAAWGKLTGNLGKFNPAHTTRAKDRGWVDSAKHGTYR